jgi:hypothetical protein
MQTVATRDQSWANLVPERDQDRASTNRPSQITVLDESIQRVTQTDSLSATRHQLLALDIIDAKRHTAELLKRAHNLRKGLVRSVQVDW